MPLRPICNVCDDPIHPDEDYVLDPRANGLPTHACCYVNLKVATVEDLVPGKQLLLPHKKPKRRKTKKK